MPCELRRVKENLKTDVRVNVSYCEFREICSQTDARVKAN